MWNTIVMLTCIGVLLGIAFLLSDDKKNINKRTVLVGLGLQTALTLFILKTPIGAKVLETIALGVNQIGAFGLQGVSFVFGDISNKMFVFAVNVLSLIIFTSALISVLNYLGVIPFCVKHIGGLLSKIMGTTKAETFCTVGNTVLGQTESPLLTKPYLKSMTDSELFAVVVSGMGSASASILIGYSQLGIPMQYLLIAVFSVPFTTLVISKIMKPAKPEDVAQDVDVVKSDATNIFDAISKGTVDGMTIAMGVGASLIAFIGLIALINGVLGIFGTNLSAIFGFVLTPLGWLFNIPANEVSAFASLIGTKISINEFVAFTEMSTMLDTLSPRTIAILGTAMCNFGAISSIGIVLGGLTAIEPTIRERLSKIVAKGLIGAILATLLSGAFVGLFF